MKRKGSKKQARPKFVLSGVRPGWGEYFMKIAEIVATRSTCNRRSVGAVLVRARVILSTGYNGAPRGMEHCDESGHEIVDGHCVRTVHAEANALVQAARNGISIDGSTMYLTHSPCYDCFKMMVNGGVSAVYYKDFYMSRYEASERVLKLAKKAGVLIKKLSA
ncbi:MAG: dCMP deaminase family protein [Patescibacteria group bacterium]